MYICLCFQAYTLPVKDLILDPVYQCHFVHKHLFISCKTGRSNNMEHGKVRIYQCLKTTGQFTPKESLRWTSFAEGSRLCLYNLERFLSHKGLKVLLPSVIPVLMVLITNTRFIDYRLTVSKKILTRFFFKNNTR